MTAHAQDIVQQAMKLPPETRKEVAEALLASLESADLPTERIATLLARSREIHEGHRPAEPAREMITDLLSQRGSAA